MICSIKIATPGAMVTDVYILFITVMGANTLTPPNATRLRSIIFKDASG